MSDGMTSERLAEIEADLSGNGCSATYESDLPLFDEACELLEEVRRLGAELRTARDSLHSVASQVRDACDGEGGMYLRPPDSELARIVEFARRWVGGSTSYVVAGQTWRLKDHPHVTARITRVEVGVAQRGGGSVNVIYMVLSDDHAESWMTHERLLDECELVTEAL